MLQQFYVDVWEAANGPTDSEGNEGFTFNLEQNPMSKAISNYVGIKKQEKLQGNTFKANLQIEERIMGLYAT